jgi:MraZ protein
VDRELMVITDRYDHVIDDKGRLAIPSQVRNAMDPQIDGTAFYLVPEGRYLQLIPEKLFEQLAGRATAGLAMSSEAAKVRRMVFAMASRLEPDKQGRVVIPDRFMVDSKTPDPFGGAMLGREVTLVGPNDRMELRNRADFVNHMRELLADRGSLQAAMQQMFSAPPPVANMGA